ncbi:peptidase M20D, amidohydrolase [Mycolicibacterium phlei]|jgi:amidohydrolase|uniref:Amidohydrolase n=1 Tax=Mycolicibacterium phlei DSM 43239 = CCUG 21000 TaxID=1226750 RepID=A0A5N5UQH4_MYCPH|nr:M20 family metallopeptidase [Mycolicibacterium phlei]VEG08291.1 peptidase M20D, amidohydrolase [Mycobacteroides chelonae]AMO60171.1 putative hydrolase YxeP [Mycolicibacterium phlei]EID16866.1 peptidase M20D, amidohydrolase [Mycolicibacterium phlei RIVM601174]KAB7751825.1 amidohydrolase [Mycolicibacterium phlei DSM 43239 = CCUG 21000]KXW60412.1 amidohydrolase [Mycolicibacterium phlei DSM 43239 = CCUG 21000]
MSMVAQAREMADELVRFRRDLHREPELGLVLPRTQERVLAALEGLPLEISTGTSCTSVTAVLRGRGDGVVLLRADMDALPVQEDTGLDFTSRIDGTMHGCGHDLHTAMLVGAARLLADQRDKLGGDVVFMFQPGEEGWEGARTMIDEGVLDAAGRRPDAAYALHVFSTLGPAGTFFSRPGVTLAASATLRVTVRGAGGHGSTPHLAKDPVPVLAEMVTALQTAVTRRFDVFDPVVLTVGVLRAGTRSNVIPATAAFEATIRTFSRESSRRVRDVVLRLVSGIADAHGVDVDADYAEGRPPTVNDADETALVREVIAETFGERRYAPLAQPFTGAEDFARVLEEVPGCIVALGALPQGADPDKAAFNHSPQAVFDDSVLPDGAALFAELAIRRLHDTTQKGR